MLRNERGEGALIIILATYVIMWFMIGPIDKKDTGDCERSDIVNMVTAEE